jgi:hypothetical protein
MGKEHSKRKELLVLGPSVEQLPDRLEHESRDNSGSIFAEKYLVRSSPKAKSGADVSFAACTAREPGKIDGPPPPHYSRPFPGR